MILNKEFHLDIAPLKNMDLERGPYHQLLSLDAINPDFVEYLADHRMSIAMTDFFTVHPWYQSRNAHVDGSNITIAEPWESRCKINWAKSDAAKSNVWYDVTDFDALRNIPPKKTPANTNFLFVPLDIAEEKYACNPVGWNVFESGVPHAIFNMSSTWQWNVSFTVTDINSAGRTSLWLSVSEVVDRLGIST